MRDHLRGCDVLLMESNHDVEMLRVGPYPWSVKQRVMSRVGHLSNDALAEFFAATMMEGPHTSCWRISRSRITIRKLPGESGKGTGCHGQTYGPQPCAAGGAKPGRWSRFDCKSV